MDAAEARRKAREKKAEALGYRETEDRWSCLVGVKAERCDASALRDLAASWSVPPQDYWRHRSPAAGCRALAGLLPQVPRVAQ